MVLSALAAEKITASASSIDRVLRPLGVARRLTFEYVREIKQAAAREAREEAAARRLHLEVCVTDAIASLDGTHAGREPAAEAVAVPGLPSKSPEKTMGDVPAEGLKAVGTPAYRGEEGHPEARSGTGSPCKRAARRRRAIQVLMAVDVGSTLKLPFKVVHASRGEDVIDVLNAIKAERGVDPLVVATDNGSENVNDEVAPFLEERKIIHLRNLPRTPRHNPCSLDRVTAVRRR
jgi:transposase InsO family protein